MTPKSHPRPSALSLVLTLFALMLLAAACGGTAETDVTLYSGDRWDATVRIEFPTSAIALAGGPAGIEQQLEQVKAEQETRGVKFSYKKDRASSPDATAYRVDMKGDNYASLEAVDIVVEPTQFDGKDALSIRYVSNSGLSGIEEIIRIHVGSILDAGSSPTDSNTLIGGSSQPIYATVTPKSSFNPWLVIGPLLAVAAVGAVVVAGRRKSAPRPQVVSPPFVVEAPDRSAATLPDDTSPALAEEETVDCPACGKATLAWSKFCMNCGARLPQVQAPQA